MKKWWTLAFLLACNVQAYESTCSHQTEYEQAERTRITKELLHNKCNFTATQKKLDGEAAKRFVQQCWSDELRNYCRREFKNQRLSESRKAQFMNQCLKINATAPSSRCGSP